MTEYNKKKTHSISCVHTCHFIISEIDDAFLPKSVKLQQKKIVEYQEKENE